MQPAEAAALLAAFNDSQENENQFQMMLKRFEPIIKIAATKAARYIDSTWREDLEATGRIALMNAARGFPRDGTPNDFLGFAINSIRNSLIDFVRRELRHTKWIKTGLPGFDYVFDQTSNSSPDYTASYSYEPGDRASPFNWTTTTTLPVNILFLLDHPAYKRIGLKDRDIQMWELYLHGNKIWEIAEGFGLSSSYCSRLLSKIRAKIYKAHK
jgi:DNA-directed RNA polymerase specialized sigma subunit